MEYYVNCCSWSRMKKSPRSNRSLTTLHLILSGTIVCLFAITFSQASEASLMEDIHAIESELPGCFSNINQYHRHAEQHVSLNKRRLLLRSEFYKVFPPLFNDSLTIFFQDFTRFAITPFRAGFYSFSIDSTNSKTIRMKTFRLTKDSAVLANNTLGQQLTEAKSEDNTISADLFSKDIVSNSNLRTHSACDMFWKRIAKYTFVGITGPKCLASLGKEKVRIGVSMTLAKDKMLLTEGWYNIRDGSRITEVKVPYIMKKIPKAAHSSETWASLQTNSVELPAYHGETMRKMSYYVHSKPYGDKRTKKNRNRRNRSRSTRFMKKSKLAESRILRNFKQVAAAVTSGHDVYFRVELSSCAGPAQVKVERFSFGGKVTNFIFVRQDGEKRKDYLYFSTGKTVMGSQGLEHIRRELTLLRGGRVEVKVIKTFGDSRKAMLQYTFQCKLFSDTRGYGAVKMSIDPTSRIETVTNFKSLTSSVDQGHDLHLVADLVRCQGSKRKPSIIVGSRISEYDMVNDGKTMEVYIPVSDATSSETSQGEHPHGLTGQIFRNGDVILTRIGGDRTNLGTHLRVSAAYHCKLSNRNAVHTNDENESGVKVFYRL